MPCFRDRLLVAVCWPPLAPLLSSAAGVRGGTGSPCVVSSWSFAACSWRLLSLAVGVLAGVGFCRMCCRIAACCSLLGSWCGSWLDALEASTATVADHRAVPLGRLWCSLWRGAGRGPLLLLEWLRWSVAHWLRVARVLVLWRLRAERRCRGDCVCCRGCGCRAVERRVVYEGVPPLVDIWRHSVVQVALWLELREVSSRMCVAGRWGCVCVATTWVWWAGCRVA